MDMRNTIIVNSFISALSLVNPTVVRIQELFKFCEENFSVKPSDLKLYNLEFQFYSVCLENKKYDVSLVSNTGDLTLDDLADELEILIGIPKYKQRLIFKGN